MSSDEPHRPYLDLAARITRGRETLGLSQAAFAAELGFKQQTVSRWEAGTHRPKREQVPTLAALIREDVSALMALAGYGIGVASSLTTLFPVDALNPEDFEHFVADVVAALHPGADINVLGSRGHGQGGSDVVLRARDGRVWDFQCKRVERFGKAEVAKAVAAYTRKADRKVLVLSKVASPAAIDAVHAHPDWALWDKQELSRRIRADLPAERQDRLVDTYFRGQRMALLGRSEPGPWQTADEYFAPFASRSAAFSHDWGLVGREQEVAALVDALGREDREITLLVGAGGIGKTRLIKEALERFGERSRGTTIRFLAQGGDVDAASLDALGAGRKLLVVDDAHDRDGLQLLVRHALDPNRNTKLLIATRPYAEQRIRNELAVFGRHHPAEVRLERLDKGSLRKLVTGVLERFGASPGWAEAVLEVAGDNTLVVLMAARVVARENVIPALAHGRQELRQVILSRFRNVVTGDLGSSSDKAAVRAVLDVLALVQPFDIEDRRLPELVSRTRPEIAAVEVDRALKLLRDGGVIYRRGRSYRLMPDLLGDFLIEDSCIGVDGRLSRFAIDIAGAVEGDRLVNVLVNLGRMDWRRADGDPSASELLEPIWRGLREITDEYDPRRRAVEAVAYYQPRQALDFIQAQIDRDGPLDDASAILRKVAYHPEHRRDALRLLWDLGREDGRDPRQHSNHPIKALAELVAYDPHKPLAVVEEMADFAFSLLDDPENWRGSSTPLDVLAPLVSAEGYTTSATGRSIAFSPFHVPREAVASIRERVVTKTLDLLRAPDPRTAHRAALFLTKALRRPIGYFGAEVPAAVRTGYEVEFGETIARIRAVLREGRLAATTVIGLIQSIAWYAEHDEGPLGEQVREVFAALPGDLDFRLHAALTERSGYQFVGQVPFAAGSRGGDWLDVFAAEVLAAYPDRSGLCDVLAHHRAAIMAAGIAGSPALVGKLVRADPAIARDIVARSHFDPETPVRIDLPCAVGALLEAHPEEGHAAIRTLLTSNDETLRVGALRSLFWLRGRPSVDVIEILRGALGSGDEILATTALDALRTLHGLEDHEIVDLSLAAPFESWHGLFEAVAALLCASEPPRIACMRDDEIDRLLERMQLLPNLDEYWTGELLRGLATRHGERVAHFILARAEIALGDQPPEHYDAIGGVYRRDRLGLESTPDAVGILRMTWHWLRLHDGAAGYDRYEIGRIVAGMVQLGSDQVVGFLDALLDRATAEDLRWIASLLRHVHHTFLFTHEPFVLRYLDRCRSVGPKLVEEAIEKLSAAAMSGSWSGTPGEPMPRDVETRDAARKVLAELSRLSPAYGLYSEVLRHAEKNIARSLEEGAAMDDEV